MLDDQLKPYRDDTTIIGRPEYSGYSQAGENGKITQHVKKDWEIKRSGYAYIFTNNLDEDDVFFENFMVITQLGPILEIHHTYPFGLMIDGISGQASGRLENKFRFNGKEMQNKEFSNDNGLEWYDYGARMYDAQIGRWNHIDPMSDDYEWLSPYTFVRNNPLIYVDPDGMSDTIINHPKPLPHILLAPAHPTSREPYRGFWGTLEYFWTGGNEGGNKFNRDGEWIGYSPNMGTPPDFSLSKFSLKDIKSAFNFFRKTAHGFKIEGQLLKIFSDRRLFSNWLKGNQSLSRIQSPLNSTEAQQIIDNAKKLGMPIESNIKGLRGLEVTGQWSGVSHFKVANIHIPIENGIDKVLKF